MSRPAHRHPPASDAHTHVASPLEQLPRQRGRRLTRPRRLIWAALTAEPDSHLTPDEIVLRVPEVDRSTVYRTLETLVADGLALRTEIGAGLATYEPAHEHLHHHVACRLCGAITHIHDDTLGDLPTRVEAASGYLIGQTELTLVGICPACRSR